MLNTGKHPAAIPSRFLAALGMTTSAAFMPLFAAGCLSHARFAPRLSPDSGASDDSNPCVEYDDWPWALTLHEVILHGRIDYDHLCDKRENLNRYLAILEQCGPESSPGAFPTPQHQLAYTLNAYNACMMAAVVLEGVPKTMYAPSTQPPENRWAFWIDGRRRLPAELRDQIRELSPDDPRPELCLFEPAIGGVPLFPTPFRAEGLDGQLDDAMAAILASPAMLEVDEAGQRLWIGRSLMNRLGAIIAFTEKRLGAPAPSPCSALAVLVAAETRPLLISASGYEPREIAFDRRLNRYDPAAGDGPPSLLDALKDFLHPFGRKGPGAARSRREPPPNSGES